jgi:hypothetical protein
VNIVIFKPDGKRIEFGFAVSLEKTVEHKFKIIHQLVVIDQTQILIGSDGINGIRTVGRLDLGPHDDIFDAVDAFHTI